MMIYAARVSPIATFLMLLTSPCNAAATLEDSPIATLARAEHPNDKTTKSTAPIYFSDYGAKCRNLASDADGDTAAIQSAADAATESGRTLHIGGPRNCIINGTINIRGKIAMVGDGPSASMIVQLANAPVFLWVASSSTVTGSMVRDFSLRGQFATDASYEKSRGFKIAGDRNFFIYNRFENLAFEGFHTAFEIAKDPYKTKFGFEQPFSWNTFNNISIIGGSKPIVNGWLFPAGSGTMNTFQQIKMQFSSNVSGAALNYPGIPGDVVGDVIFSGNISADTRGTTILNVGPGTVYRSNIRISNSQIDGIAQVAPMRLAEDGQTKFKSIFFQGNNVGGTASISNGSPTQMATSIIDDYEVDSRRSGNTKAVGQKGKSSSSNLFKVGFHSPSYGGTRCTLTVSGLVDGIGGGIITGTFLIGSDGDNISVIPVDNPVATNTKTGFFKLDYSVTANDATLGVTETGTARLDAQIACAAGTYSLSRL